MPQLAFRAQKITLLNFWDYIIWKMQSSLQDNLWLIVLKYTVQSSQGQTDGGVYDLLGNVHRMYVSVCVAHPTHQAGDFPLTASATNIRCFLTSPDPEDPLPQTVFLPFFPPLLLHWTTQQRESGNMKRNRESVERQSCPPRVCPCIWKWYIEAWGVFSA